MINAFLFRDDDKTYLLYANIAGHQHYFWLQQGEQIS